MRTLRGSGPWLFAPALLSSWYLVGRLVNPQVALWAEAGRTVEYSLVILGPLAGAVVAYHSVRDSRQPMRELIDGSARSETVRALVLVGGELLAFLIVFAVATAWLFLRTAIQATFGGPDVELVAAGLSALIACGAIGYFVGKVLPHFLVPPLVGVGLWTAMWVISTGAGPSRLLTPTLDVIPNAFSPLRPAIGILQTVWFSAIALAAISGALLWRSASTSRAIGFMVGLGLAIAAAGGLTGLGPNLSASVGSDVARCDTFDSLVVCVHPAFETMLPTIGEAVAGVTSPLIDALGWPEEARQVKSPQDAREVRQRDLSIYGFTFSYYQPGQFERSVADDVVGYVFCTDLQSEDPIRDGLALWLVEQAMKPRGGGEAAGFAHHDDSASEQERIVADRLASMGDAERMLWLRENFFRLQACDQVQLSEADA